MALPGKVAMFVVSIEPKKLDRLPNSIVISPGRIEILSSSLIIF
jgi:hypothetical protein